MLVKLAATAAAGFQVPVSLGRSVRLVAKAGAVGSKAAGLVGRLARSVVTPVTGGRGNSSPRSQGTSRRVRQVGALSRSGAPQGRGVSR